MRRNLLIRLLGLSLAVAAFAIAATAWLTTRDTGERFRGEFERTLEADTFIYQELVAYAGAHESWRQADALVAELAERTGRRVALTTVEGVLIVDSAELAGTPAPALPSNPTAEVDVLTSSSAVGGSVQLSYGGDTVLADVVTEPASTIEDAVPGSVTFTTTAQWPEVSSLWRMSAEEAEERRRLAAEAQQCLRRAREGAGDVVVGPSGEVFLLTDESAEGSAESAEVVAGHEHVIEDRLTGLSFGGFDEDVQECLPDELARPSEAALALNAEDIRLREECLTEAGVPYEVVTTAGGLSRIIAVESGQDDEEHAATAARWRECEESAWQEAISDFVAEPAYLYTGTIDRFDPFFGDGWWRTVAAGAAVLAVAGGVTVLAGRRLTRPIRELTGAARRMGTGDHSVRVGIDGHDEVARLGEAFNSMAESIEANERQRRAMISDIAHELRTPLANVRGYLEAAEDGVVPLDAPLVTSLLEESGLLQRLIDDLQDLALADAGMLRVHPEPRNATELVRQVVAAHRAGAGDAGVRLLTDDDTDTNAAADDDLTVSVDPERLRQALGNLVSNAIRFTPEGGEVTVSARRDGSSVLFVVEDTGDGIPAEHLPRLFDRFYRVEGSRSRQTGGSGLGLAITRHLVEAHGGRVDVDSTEGAGSTFTIRLPVHSPVGVG